MATGALSAYAEACSKSAVKVRVGTRPSLRDLNRFPRLFPALKCWANLVSPSGATFPEYTPHKTLTASLSLRPLPAETTHIRSLISISGCHACFIDRRFFRADSHSVERAMDKEKRNDKEYGREDVSQHRPLLNRQLYGQFHC